VLAPSGIGLERANLFDAGEPFEPEVANRELPQLSDNPTWRQILNRAFLANGQLEAAYFQWKAALARIDIAASWPNSNVELGFDYLFSSEQMKSWDRTTIFAGFDPAMSLTLPQKARQAGKVALAEARAAGVLFEQMKFDLQRDALVAWFDYLRAAQLERIERDNVALLRLLADTASARVQAGGPQQDLLKAQIELSLAENTLQKLQAERVSLRATVNALIAREPDAPLNPPAELPAPRAMPVDDARIIAIAVDKNKELAALAHQVQGRRDALELARMQWIPDFNVTAGFTGTISQFVGASLMLPTNAPAIRGAIEESRATLRAQEAILRQGKLDRAAEVVAALLMARDAARQSDLFEQQVLPRARQTLDAAREAYSAGRAGFIELIEAQRTLLDVRRMIVEARITRENALAELECLICADIETITESTTAPDATSPTTTAPEVIEP
jgi:outer membrane protein TolC